MKKILNSVFLVMVMLLVGIVSAKAIIRVPEGKNSCSSGSDVSGSMSCQLKLEATSGDSIKQGDTITVVFGNAVNIKDNKVTISASDGWTIDGETAKELTLSSNVTVTMTYNGTADITGEFVFATATYLKEDTGVGCSFGYNVPVTRSCGTVTSGGQTYYYGKDGQLITEGKDGRTIEEEMNYQCFSCTVADAEGNYYYNGKKLDAEGFATYCAPKCKIVDDKYFDKDGKEITKDEYKKQCMCRIEETKDGKVYYNDKNEEISQAEYENQCATPVPTGANVPYILIIGGLLGASAIFFTVKNKSKLRNM